VDAGPRANDAAAVMVWLHGGGNLYGAANEPNPLWLPDAPLFDGCPLAEKWKVIVVTLNHRLGVFGFFMHPSLTAEDPANTGNQGLLDQRAALEWVRKNIAAFGGDRDNVTFFGHSSGAWDVCLHLVSPGSRGLFQRAISESFGCTTRHKEAAEVEANATHLISTLGCNSAGDVLRCLREVPTADVLRAAGTDFVPGVDGSVLPEQPRALFDSGQFAKVPYIAGSTSDEGTLTFAGVAPVTTEAEYLAALHQLYGDLADEVATVYPAGKFASPQEALNRAYADFLLVCPTYDSARRAAAGGASVYLYNFARVPPFPVVEALKLGATHTAELGYVFGPVEPPSATDAALAAAMQGYWTRFARAGDPNGEGAPSWPRYGDASDQRLNLDADISVISGFRRPECEFWWGVYDREFE
jgi:para-nitrobenzyl esterase